MAMLEDTFNGFSHCLYYCGRRSGSVHQIWDLKVKRLSPGWCTHVVFLRKTLTFAVPNNNLY